MKKTIVCGMLLGLLTTVGSAQRARTEPGMVPRARTVGVGPSVPMTPNVGVGATSGNLGHDGVAPSARTTGSKASTVTPNATNGTTASTVKPNATSDNTARTVDPNAANGTQASTVNSSATRGTQAETVGPDASTNRDQAIPADARSVGDRVPVSPQQ
jgi:hypothetical protein